MSGKRILILAIACASFACCAPSLAAAAGTRVDAGTWEAGIILGEPTGFSAKYWTTWQGALDFGAAWSFEGDGHFHVHCDYLFHNFDYFDVEEGSLPLYFGIGGRVRVEEDDTRLGLRLVVGMEYLFEKYPMSLFFEVAPILDFVPETEASANGGLGIRFVF